MNESMDNVNSRSKIRVIDLFAGVGGFRIGLEGTPQKPSQYYKVVWSNQWEPSTKGQHAADIYQLRFGPQSTYFNVDIQKVVATGAKKNIPDHDLLVGGFPCQDYSVARTLSQAAGIVGKKGVLWWSIHQILKDKGEKKPRYLMLENVDRLLKSPASQRGRDFAIMLASLSDLGYVVEWRVINAAEYGMPQRRRRTYILGYLRSSEVGLELKQSRSPIKWMAQDGLFAQSFPIQNIEEDAIDSFELNGDLVDISKTFNLSSPATSPFKNAGVMIGGKVITAKTKPSYSGKITTLGDILQNNADVPEEFFIDKKDLPQWKKMKGAKNEIRKTQSGHEYHYTEGSIPFPDPLDKPSRTIVTGEGGATPSRFKHVILTPDGRYRRLTPIELEKLNMFPANHTKGAAAVKRAFFMGNALVVGVIERLGKELAKRAYQPLPKKDKQLELA